MVPTGRMKRQAMKHQQVARFELDGDFRIEQRLVVRVIGAEEQRLVQTLAGVRLTMGSRDDEQPAVALGLVP